MLNTGQCPKCESTITKVDHEHVDIGTALKKQWHGISYICPSCRAVLGVQIDPIALKADIVSEILAGLRG